MNKVLECYNVDKWKIMQSNLFLQFVPFSNQKINDKKVGAQVATSPLVETFLKAILVNDDLAFRTSCYVLVCEIWVSITNRN